MLQDRQQLQNFILDNHLRNHNCIKMQDPNSNWHLPSVHDVLYILLYPVECDLNRLHMVLEYFPRHNWDPFKCKITMLIIFYYLYKFNIQTMKFVNNYYFLAPIYLFLTDFNVDMCYAWLTLILMKHFSTIKSANGRTQ